MQPAWTETLLSEPRGASQSRRTATRRVAVRLWPLSTVRVMRIESGDGVQSWGRGTPRRA